MPSFEEYIETLFKQIVGGMGVPPFSFYQLTIAEAMLMIEGFRQQEEWQYNLTFTAMYNANGYFHGSDGKRKFKPIDPFDYKEDNKKSQPKKVDKEVYDNTLNHLMERFREVK